MAQTLGALTATTETDVLIKGTSGQTLDAATLSAAGGVASAPVIGTLTQTLNSIIAPSVTVAPSSLLHFDGTDGSQIIVDEASHTWTAVGNAQLDTAQAKFGSSSLLLDGTGDYLTGDGGSDFAFGTGAFTIDFWVRVNVLGTTTVFYDSRPSGVEGFYIAIYKNTANQLRVRINTLTQISGTTALTSGQWHHIAFTRSGTNTRLFLNGVQEGGTFTADGNSYLNGASRPTIGGDGNAPNTNLLAGAFDEIRVIKGTALWTSNFSPPSAPYIEANSGTVLVAGTSTPTLAPATLAATGTVPISAITGTLSQTLGVLTVTASDADVVIKGTLAQSLGALTASASDADVVVTGTATPTLGAITVSASDADVFVKGTATPTLAAVTSTTDADVFIVGMTTATLAAATLVAAGTVSALASIVGTLTQTFGALTVTTSDADVLVKGTATPILGAITVSTSAGKVAIAGTATPTLGAVTSTSDVDVVVKGTLAQSLGTATLSATGTAFFTTGVNGDLAVTLGAVTVSAAGKVNIVGTATPTLAASTSTTDTDVVVKGALTATLAPATVSSDVDVRITGYLNTPLGVVPLAADADVFVKGTSAQRSAR